MAQPLNRKEVVMTEKNTLLVFTNPVEGREDEYNDWYDRVHVPDLLKVPGVVSAQRYEVVPDGNGEPRHKYLAVYEIDGDPAEVTAELGRRMATGEIPLSDTLDVKTAKLGTWRARGPQQTAG
jgi:hypothetical protein